MLSFAVEGGTLRRVSLDGALQECVFIQAPNKAAVEAAGVKLVEGDCIDNTPVSEIKIGLKYSFVAGDPIKFRGTPREVVEFEGDNRYLRIVINREVTLFVWVIEEKCITLEYTVKTSR